MGAQLFVRLERLGSMRRREVYAQESTADVGPKHSPDLFCSGFKEQVHIYVIGIDTVLRHVHIPEAQNKKRHV